MIETMDKRNSEVYKMKNFFNAINEWIPIRYRVIHTVAERKTFCKYYILPVYKHKDGTYKNY